MSDDGLRLKITIFHKIIIYIVVTIIVTVGISTYISVISESHLLSRAMDRAACEMGGNFAECTKNAFGSLNWIYVEKQLKKVVKNEQIEVIYAKIVNPAAEVYMANDTRYYGDSVNPALLSGTRSLLTDFVFEDLELSGNLLVYPIEIGGEKWHVLLAYSTEPVKKAIRELVGRNLVFGGLIMLLGIFVSYIVSKSISRPIGILALAAEEVAGGNWKTVDIDSKDEVGSLAHAFNLMITSLHKTTDKLKKSEKELKMHRDNLKELVDERTAELEQAYEKLKNTQATIVHQEKMASIGQLAAGVAHEINNPTGFVRSNLSTLDKYVGRLTEFLKAQAKTIELIPENSNTLELSKKKKKLKIDYICDDADDLIKESIEGADRIKSIVENLKGFSRVDQAEKQVADINECLESTLNIVWNELKYVAKVEKSYGDIQPIECFPQELNQVFMNLLVNAAHSIEKEGTISIKTWKDDEFVYVSVSDTGCGISPEHLNRIFEPFFTTKDVGKGTGLGLSIVYDIITKKHKGDINVKSEPGKGTTFTVKLPAG